MAPVYADHPFPLLSTPAFVAQGKDPNVQIDMFDRIASEMTNVHNVLIRGLNSIYLQAPHIQPADEKSFCKYIIGWHGRLHSHHTGEERLFFPAIERLSGVKGIMDGNVEQHRVFHDGVDELKACVEHMLNGKTKYDGGKIVAIIDGFGSALTRHLADEIPTILSLKQYGKEKMGPLNKVVEQEAGEAVKELGTFGMVWFFANLDVHYEDNLWLSWPPAPAPVKGLIRSVLWWMHPDARRWSAVDRMGKLRPLAVPHGSS